MQIKRQNKSGSKLTLIYGIIFLGCAICCILYMLCFSISVDAKITSISDNQCYITAGARGRKPSYGVSYNVEYLVNDKIYKKTTECMGKIADYQNETIKVYVQKNNPEISISKKYLFIFIILGLIFGSVFLGVGTDIIKS